LGYLLQDAEQYVCVQGTLMCFVHYYNAVLLQVGVLQGFSQ
jgi:hypothetical protein